MFSIDSASRPVLLNLCGKTGPDRAGAPILFGYRVDTCGDTVPGAVGGSFLVQKLSILVAGPRGVIRYFLAVAEDLNFTKAAERCNVSQPALSRAIQGLEQELGGLLFRRERRHTHLSELGRMVQPHLAEVFDSTRSAKRAAQEYARLGKTPLKLGIMSTIAPDQIIDLTPAQHGLFAHRSGSGVGTTPASVFG